MPKRKVYIYPGQCEKEVRERVFIGSLKTPAERKKEMEEKCKKFLSLPRKSRP